MLNRPSTVNIRGKRCALCCGKFGLVVTTPAIRTSFEEVLERFNLPGMRPQLLHPFRGRLGLQRALE